MSTKTITVTVTAYEALKSLKEPKESFSDTLLRVAKRKPLSTFFGALSRKSGERLEQAVTGLRKQRNEAHRARLKQLREALNA